MNDDQKRAFEYWIDSATFENDFTTVTLPDLAKWCEVEDIKTSKSSLGRWKKRFGWDKALETKVTASVVKGEAKKIVSETSLAETVGKSNDDFDKNSEAKDYTYILLIHDLKLLIEKIQGGKATTKEDKRFYLKALEILAGREDKLLDRIANLQLVSNLSSPEEALAALRETVIDLEDNVTEADIIIQE